MRHHRHLPVRHFGVPTAEKALAALIDEPIEHRWLVLGAYASCDTAALDALVAANLEYAGIEIGFHPLTSDMASRLARLRTFGAYYNLSHLPDTIAAELAYRVDQDYGTILDLTLRAPLDEATARSLVSPNNKFYADRSLGITLPLLGHAAAKILAQHPGELYIGLGPAELDAPVALALTQLAGPSLVISLQRRPDADTISLLASNPDKAFQLARCHGWHGDVFWHVSLSAHDLAPGRAPANSRFGPTFRTVKLPT